ncbi:TraC family protein [Candidatus Saccharibacteria bacterium]|nr:TraC family protein [Candidatus Saccharibacteria bacterium]
MFALQKSKNKTSARNQIAIKGVEDGILLLPNNEYRAVLQVSSLNFELRSEEEQDAIIDTYESFLNSVGSSLQILVRTREIDMDKYLEDLGDRLNGETEQIYRDQLQNYDEFIRSLITTNKILTRHFYIVVPYSIKGKADFELVQEQINLKLDIVAKGMMRIGIHTKQLSSLETLDLFYSFYSPAEAKLQPLTEQALRMIHTAMIEKGDSDE